MYRENSEERAAIMELMLTHVDQVARRGSSWPVSIRQPLEAIAEARVALKTDEDVRHKLKIRH